MIVNFEVEDNYALNYEGKHIDLHNNFDFRSYDYIVADRQLTLIWIKLTGDWVGKNELSKLKLIHNNVSFLQFNYDNKDYQYPEDDKCLSEVTFFPSSDREINNGFIPQATPNDGDDILYIFETDYYIRVGCDEIMLEVE